MLPLLGYGVTKKPAIVIDEGICLCLHTEVGRQGIRRSRLGAVRPRLTKKCLDRACRQMAADEAREAAALAWSEAMLGGIELCR